MMKFKLKNRNGKVAFLLKSGEDFVKNEMSVASAQHIIDNGELKESDKEDYPINIDDKWFFEGEPVKAENKIIGKSKKEK